MIRACVGLGVATVLLSCSISAFAKPPYGALSQLPGRDGCTGVFFDSCRPGTLSGQKIALSPDQRFAYVASDRGDVAGYARNRRTGALRSLPGTRGCVVGAGTFDETPAASVCTQWNILGAVPDVNIALSPDGRNVYLGSGGLQYVPPRETDRPSVLATLGRDALGKLGPLACTARAVEGCAPARGLGDWVSGLAVSPDGRNVYVASSARFAAATTSGIAVFTREPGSGALSQLPGAAGCIAPAASDGCGTARALGRSTSSVVVSPDGRSVYVASSASRGPGNTSGTILAFGRDSSSGALEQLAGAAGCLAADGGEGCAVAKPLGAGPDQLPELVVSPEGDNLYTPFVADTLVGGLTLFRRDRVSGALTQPAGEAGCFSQAPMPGCRTGRALYDPTGIAISGDGRNVYVSAFNSAAIAVFVRGEGGALRQPAGPAGCVGGNLLLFHEGCARGPGVQQDLTLSDDGRYGYVGTEQGLIVFSRNGPTIRLRLGRCEQSGLPVGVRVSTSGGLGRVLVRLDGRLISTRAGPRFQLIIPTRRLGSRGHRLSVVAIDRVGRRALRARRVARCGG